MPETIAYIALGSNLSPEENIARALKLLATRCRLIDVSRFYRTAPIDGEGQPDYLNGAAKVGTDRSPRAFKFDVLRGIEEALGRTRTADRNAARCIDLDILLFGGRSWDEPGLQVPDPDIATRPFLAASLLDLWADAALPSGARVEALFGRDVFEALRSEEAFSRRMKTRFVP